LDRSGQVDKLAEFHDLADVQAVTEEEIRAAVEELNRSTSVVAKQAETLRQQQDALSRLVKRAGERESARDDFERKRQHNSETERKFISAEVRRYAVP
jgi:low affinity Fe/Cu permease